ncbi:hypothetical protein U8335_11395 [Roseiconus lacunae]|uniref:hypothetical protein n=1 Tax=Roseiconus lacunae TaxID=2605694 RepID=UPI00308CAC40|nr:hypothetical protein U8335_11395 [Stieleria sp. HD01]
MNCKTKTEPSFDRIDQRLDRLIEAIEQIDPIKPDPEAVRRCLRFVCGEVSTEFGLAENRLQRIANRAAAALARLLELKAAIDAEESSAITKRASL